VLHALNATPTCDRNVVDVDFREPWSDRLLDGGYRPEARAEGLTFYLDETAVRNLLRDIARLAIPGDALGCDFVTEPPLRVTAAAHGFSTDDPTRLFTECGRTAERYSFDREGKKIGRSWPSALRPWGYMTIARRA
jgi:O-methyltransferase involved in polyketide biosynthesis